MRAPDVAGDLSARLGEATVTWDGKAPRGRSPGGRWLGPSARDHWVWVGPHRGVATTDKGPETRSCIWAHASDGPLRVVFPHGVGQPGVGLHVRGEVALLDTPRAGAPAELRVLSGERQLTRARVIDTDGGRRWAPWEVALDGGAELVFELTTTKPDWRQLCFTAHVSAQ